MYFSEKKTTEAIYNIKRIKRVKQISKKYLD